MNNLTGQTFCSLTVLKPSLKRHKSGEIIWDCSCECGRRISYRSSKISQGLRTSCGQCKPSERKGKTQETRRRNRRSRGKIHFSQLPPKKQLEIIYDFAILGNYNELSRKYGVTRHTLKDGITLFRQKLNTMFELEYMANAEQAQLSAEVVEKALQTDFISESLRDMLSDDTTEVLTPQEIMYCYLWVNTGSNVIALKESQLDSCLTEKTPVRLQYLGMHLREKPNLKLYIKSLQDEQVDEVVASKKIVQHELIKQIEQLKEVIAVGGKTTDRSNLIKCIELLGKTCRAFEEHITFDKASASSSLDRLLEMAKADVKELPPGSADEVYEVSDPSQGEDQGLGDSDS